MRDKTYQRDTKLGEAVAKYLAWKQFRASERTLIIYEGYLARLAVDLAHINPAVDEVTEDMLLDALGRYPAWFVAARPHHLLRLLRWASVRGLRDKNPVELLPSIREPTTKVYDVFTASPNRRS